MMLLEEQELLIESDEKPFLGSGQLVEKLTLEVVSLLSKIP